ncbi:MAG: glycosyltransferase [Verrucomicrobiota bacterium]|jgi:glycosyltransferase involved in cell wall biosynthesis
MATHNGERFIKEQMESILRELGEEDEVVVSDDGSTDRTVLLVKDFDDRRIRLFEGNSFRSAVLNFEFSLRQCLGRFIFLSDQDDIWCPGKVAAMTNLLSMHDLVQSDACIIDESSTVLVPSVFRAGHCGAGLLKNLCHNSYYGNSMAFRRRLLDWSLPFPANVAMHDWWIGLVCELLGKPCFHDRVLTRWRRHAHNTTPVGGRSNTPLLRRLRWRVELMANLSRRFWRAKSAGRSMACKADVAGI